MREHLYVTSDKLEQDIKLSYMITLGPIERKRSSKPNPRARKFNTMYHLKPTSTKRPLRVCLKFFTAVLGVTKDRVNRLCKKIASGVVLKDRRGGDRVSHKSQAKKEKVIEFIGNLNGRESHYNRAKSKRIYLPAHLNIAKLHKMYNSQCEQTSDHCSLTMFKVIFRRKFNIGFSSPASDCCALCNRLKHKIKIEKNPKEKSDLMIQLRIHKKRANAFYTLTKETPENSLSFCFDMQQVQPLPRTPINDAFYAQQLSFYSFCCVDMQSKSPTFYTWTEDMAGRGSVEVASALLEHLDSLNLTGTKILRLFCDGCGGQNKNSHVVHALYFWLKQRSPEDLLEIHLTFPVRGHSFLPADRVFGRVEKELRKTTTITKKEGYEELYSQFGEVKTLGSEWLLYDVKGLQKYLKKVDGISDVKRIKLLKSDRQKFSITITCFENYRFESIRETPKTLLKKGKTESELKLDLLELGRDIQDKKIKSLKNLLLQEFGERWEEDADLVWYKNILLRPGTAGIQPTEEHGEEEICDCLEDDIGLRI